MKCSRNVEHKMVPVEDKHKATYLRLPLLIYFELFKFPALHIMAQQLKHFHAHVTQATLSWAINFPTSLKQQRPLSFWQRNQGGLPMSKGMSNWLHLIRKKKYCSCRFCQKDCNKKVNRTVYHIPLTIQFKGAISSNIMRPVACW